MSARKTRLEFGTTVAPGMSIRDVAAAVGVSETEQSRWVALAALSDAEFEQRLAAHRDSGRPASATSILSADAPVPARGRVARACALWRNMAPAKRGRFLDLIGVQP